jgi:hypothetical protein
MGKDENSGVYTKREIPGHHKQNKANQIMETEEQRARRLGSTWTQKFGWEYDPDIEAELSRVVKEEMAKDLKRMYNNVPTVSDRMKPIR